MAKQQETENGVEERGRGIFDYDLFRQNMERALSMPHAPAEPPKLTTEDRLSYAAYTVGLFAGYWLAWIPAHLIRGLWAGVCDAWERAGE